MKHLYEQKAKLVAELDKIRSLESITEEQRATAKKIIEDVQVLDKQIEEEKRSREEIDAFVRSQKESEGRKSPQDNPENRGNKSKEETAFVRYLRYGVDGINPTEYRAMTMGTDTSGGHLVPDENFQAELIAKIYDYCPLYGLCKRYNGAGSVTMSWPAKTANMAAFGYTTETAIGSADATLAYGKRTITSVPFGGYIKISNTLLNNAAINPVDEITSEMGQAMAVGFETEICVGDGNTNHCLGIFTDSASGISTGRDVSTGNTATAVTLEGLRRAVGKLKSQYRSGAYWVFHRDLETELYLMSDDNGRPLLQPSVKDGFVPTLMGFPYVLSEKAPATFTSGLYVAVLGNLQHFKIVEQLPFQIKRTDHRYFEEDNVAFSARTNFSGAPVDEDAFVRVKLG